MFRLIAFTMGLTLLLFARFASAVDYVRPGGECAAVDNTSFCYRGGEYKFVGINLQAIAHLDKVLTPPQPYEVIEAEWNEQLIAARDMGVSVIRIFAPHKDKSPSDAQASVLAFMNKASEVFGEQQREVKFIINLTDFYNNPNKATTEKDDAYDGKGHLKPSWFTTGGAPPNYEVDYMNFINTFVTPPLTTDPRIFAWQLGNEIQSGRGDDASKNGARERMLDFAYTVGRHLKYVRGVKQMVVPGFLGTNHAVAGELAGTLENTVCLVYHYWAPGVTECQLGIQAKNSPFDFVYFHGYNNEWSPQPPPCPECPFPYQWQDADMNWANTHDFPYVIGEFGFNGAYTSGNCKDGPFTGGDWGTIKLPPAGDNRAKLEGGVDGVTAVAMYHFYHDFSADGILHWGFMVKLPWMESHWPDNGLGDECSGMGNGNFYGDWPEMEALFRYWSSQLPGGANIVLNGTIEVPASGTTLDTETIDSDPQTQSFDMSDTVVPAENPGPLNLNHHDKTVMTGEVRVMGETTIGGAPED